MAAGGLFEVKMTGIAGGKFNGIFAVQARRDAQWGPAERLHEKGRKQGGSRAQEHLLKALAHQLRDCSV
jgi:hypothetical protein